MASRCFIAVGMLGIRLVESACFVQQVFYHMLVVSHRCSHICGPGSVAVMGPLGFQEFGGARRLDGFQDRRVCFSVGSAVRDRGMGVEHRQCDRVYGGVVG